MRKLLILTIILSKVFTQSPPPPVPAIEMIIKVTNSSPGVSRTFTATSINGVIWENENTNRFYIVDNPSDFNNQSVIIPDGDYYGQEIGFDNNGDAEDDYPQLRLSDYEISVSGSNATVIIEWQGCFSGATGDVTVTYNAQANSFSLYNPPTPSGEECLQPTDPYDLVITTLGQNPFLDWSNSDYPQIALTYNVYRKINYGNWTLIAEQTPASMYIDYDVQYGKPYSETYYYKVFAVSGDGTKVSENSTNIASIMGNGIANKSILQNQSLVPADFSVNIFPNPFNPQTTIKFGFPEKSMVNIEIYDLLGHKMNTLYHKKIDQGFHQIRWNGEDDMGNLVPSGNYLCRLSTFSLESEKQYVKKQKIILMK